MEEGESGGIFTNKTMRLCRFRNFSVFFRRQSASHAAGAKTLPKSLPFKTAVPAAFLDFFFGKFPADYRIME
jgi:hypothetical protein